MEHSKLWDPCPEVRERRFKWTSDGQQQQQQQLGWCNNKDDPRAKNSFAIFQWGWPAPPRCDANKYFYNFLFVEICIFLLRCVVLCLPFPLCALPLCHFRFWRLGGNFYSLAIIAKFPLLRLLGASAHPTGCPQTIPSDFQCVCEWN